MFEACGVVDVRRRVIRPEDRTDDLIIALRLSIGNKESEDSYMLLPKIWIQLPSQ